MNPLWLIAIATVYQFEFGLGANIDADKVDSVVSNYENAFQTVAVADVNNFTKIVDILHGPIFRLEGIIELEMLIKQFLYSYSKFQIATEKLIEIGEENLTDGKSAEAVYISNKDFFGSISLLKRINGTLGSIIQVTETLYRDALSMPKVVKVDANGIGTISMSAYRILVKGFAEWHQLNKQNANYLDELSIKIRNFLISSDWINSKSPKIAKVFEPINEYGNIMQILSHLCSRLANLIPQLVPTSDGLPSGNSTTAVFDVKHVLDVSAVVVEQIRNVYELAAQANTKILKVLELYNIKLPLTSPKPFISFPY